MGCWGPGPFDNDTAADWAYSLTDMSCTEARADLLTITLRAFIETEVELAGTFDLIEFDSLLEQAVAAAAFVADAHTGQRRFTDNAFAQSLAEDNTTIVYTEVAPPSDYLRALAFKALGKAMEMTEEDSSSTDWRMSVGQIGTELTRPPNGR
jgi:hypothetical protein